MITLWKRAVTTPKSKVLPKTILNLLVIVLDIMFWIKLAALFYPELRLIIQFIILNFNTRVYKCTRKIGSVAGKAHLHKYPKIWYLFQQKNIYIFETIFTAINLHVVTYNPGQNIWNKIEKSSRARQNKKILIFTFAGFFDWYCQSWISGGGTKS